MKALTRRSAITIAAVAASVHFSCASPMVETNPKAPIAIQEEQIVGESAGPAKKAGKGPEETAAPRAPIVISEEGTTRDSDKNSQAADNAPESSRVNPFSLNPELRKIASSLSGNARQKAEKLFETLHRGAPNGVKVMDMEGKMPRVASEVLKLGGDCTDLAVLAISLLKEAKVPGGAFVVHFEKAPGDFEHMVPYVILDGEKVIFDLQAGKLGQSGKGRYELRMDLTYDEATAIYFQEAGDYYLGKKMNAEAIAAYSASLGIYEPNAYVHNNISTRYGRVGDDKNAMKHMKRAAELDKRYAKKTVKKLGYDAELAAGDAAYSDKKWAECAQHYQAALDSGERISETDRATIQGNLDYCKKMAGQ